MAAPDAIVVGGGIAGLSALAALAADRKTLLLEREPFLAAHASGRNAAIYRPLEHDQSSAVLARRSLELFTALEAGGAPPLLQKTGLLLASAERAALASLLAHGREHGVSCDPIEGRELFACAPSVEGGELSAGVFVPGGGVIDLHALHAALASAARADGAELRTGVEVAQLCVRRGRVEGVTLADGSELPCAAVVIAAGAWGRALGARAGSTLPLLPVRRHLVQLDLGVALRANEPVVWRLDDELYYRAESGGVLASPCDATPWPEGEPALDPSVLEQLARKINRTAPALAGAKVRRYWSCLRTFAPDRELVVGADPVVENLYWLAGLGGRGMAVAPAAGELLAACVRGQVHALASALAPARFAMR